MPYSYLYTVKLNLKLIESVEMLGFIIEVLLWFHVIIRNDTIQSTSANSNTQGNKKIVLITECAN